MQINQRPVSNRRELRLPDVNLSFSDWEIPPLRWVATLSDHSQVFQDDGKYTPASAWIRLKKYLDETGLSIEKLVVQFRSHSEEIPRASGYFFRKACVAAWGCESYEHYIFGIANGDSYKGLWYLVPELLLVKEEPRDLEKDREHIIWNVKEENLIK